MVSDEGKLRDKLDTRNVTALSLPRSQRSISGYELHRGSFSRGTNEEKLRNLKDFYELVMGWFERRWTFKCKGSQRKATGRFIARYTDVAPHEESAGAIQVPNIGWDGQSKEKSWPPEKCTGTPLLALQAQAKPVLL